ncbi:hypothetical protein GCM10027454_22250 [Algoriphagus aestuariicola]
MNVKTKLKTDRNHTISMAGMCGMNFTDTFIIAKKIPAKSMDWTLLIFNSNEGLVVVYLCKVNQLRISSGYQNFILPKLSSPQLLYRNLWH